MTSIRAANDADTHTAKITGHALSCDCTNCSLVRSEAYRAFAKEYAAHNDRPVREVTTEDLLVDAIRRTTSDTRTSSRAELTRRGIDWTVYIAR